MSPSASGHEIAVAAIAARYANRPAWQKAYIDRLARDREARAISREYRKAQGAPGEKRECTKCAEVLPLDRFSLGPNGMPISRCKPCKAVQVRESHCRRRSAQPSKAEPADKTPEGPRRCTKCAEVLPLDRFGLRPNGMALSQCKPCRLEGVRESKRRKRWGPPGEAAADATDSIMRLAAQLSGTYSGEWLTSEQAMESAASELRRLWTASARKQCIVCKAMVTPSEMLPPSPGNSYPWHCRGCASEAWEGGHRATFGPLMGPLKGPPRLLMNDGSRTGVAEIARRVRERQSVLRVTHYA